MAIYKVDVQKRISQEYWTNRWLITAPDFQSADEIASTVIVPMERAIHSSAVTFDRVRTSDMVPGTDQFLTRPLTGTGGLPTDGTSLYPLFNTIRVDLTAGFGRPSRKYLRGNLFEGNVQDSLISLVLLSGIKADIDSVIELGVLVDPQNTPLTEAIPYNQVQMRQLRRGSKRKSPVIP